MRSNLVYNRKAVLAAAVLFVHASVILARGDVESKWEESEDNWDESPPVALAQTSAGVCASWVMGSQTGDAIACSGSRQCITTTAGDATSSACDDSDICSGMGTGSFSITDGTCGILPGSGQQVYCSATTPAGGVIPSSVTCTDIVITTPAPGPSPSTDPATEAPTPSDGATIITPPPPSPPTSSPAECGVYVQGSMKNESEACSGGNYLQCLTSELDDVKTSNCDVHQMCNGMGRGYYSIANGGCGTIQGQKMYCSKTSPPGGEIPASVECPEIQINHGSSSATKSSSVYDSGAASLAPLGAAAWLAAAAAGLAHAH